MNNSALMIQLAIWNKDNEALSGFLSEINPKKASLLMQKAGEHFDIPTIDINGLVYAHLGKAAQVIGYLGESNTGGLGKLMKNYQIQCPKIGWYGPEVQTRIRETFNLNPKDNRATLLPWEGFLFAGMYGRNDAADSIKVYLVKIEGAAQLSMGISEDPEWDYKRRTQLIQCLSLAEKMKDPARLEIINTEIEALTGRKLPQPAQGKLTYN